MTNIKMSDVFNLPLSTDGSTVYDLRPSLWMGKPSVENNYFFGVQNTKAGGIDKDLTAKVIADCINQHDALVELNKELIEALEFQMCNLDPKVAPLIKRAKEIQND